MDLSATTARAVRMRSLLLATRPDEEDPRTVADVVGWFGAMQAQDYDSGLWSLGCRLPSRSRAEVEQALERGEVVRTWPMRGTLHLVPARDAHWMLELMGARALAAAAGRRATLGLDEATVERAVEVLAEAVGERGRLTRVECVAALERGGVPAAGQRAYHLLWVASQRGVLCPAPNRGSAQTFVLLDEWVPDRNRPERDEALATIALRYLRSHGPATRRDFIGWTGLTAADADRALALAADTVTPVTVDGVGMLASSDSLAAVDRVPQDEFRALPGFDEYLLGFKDRSLVLAPGDSQAVIPGGSGMFAPTLVRGGRVVGTWRRATLRARTVVTVRPLRRLSGPARRAAEAAFAPYSDYLMTPVEVRWA